MTVTINGTTGIAGTNGSAGTPAVQGEDTNTGVFFPAADTVAVSTGGSERMRVDASGNLGVGTASPSVRLHVANAGGDNVSYFERVGGSRTILYNSGSDSYFGTTTNTPLRFATNDVERARIDTSGNMSVSGAVTAAAFYGPASSLGQVATFPTANNQDFNSLTTGGVYNIVWGNFSGTLNIPPSSNSYGTLFVEAGANFITQTYSPHAGSANFYPAYRVYYNGSWTDWTVGVTSANFATYLASAGTNYQIFTASGTWTKPSGFSPNALVIAQIWGGGGGGGQYSGGGGGAYNEYIARLADLPSTVSVVVGAGGNTNAAGGTSQFVRSAVGGGGGGYSTGGAGGGFSGTLGSYGGGAGGGGNAPNIWAGGGGGSDSSVAATRTGGSAVMGGGGGAASVAGSGGTGVPGGTSLGGGSGGARFAVGNAPGGGGGSNYCAGARGEVRVFVIG